MCRAARADRGVVVRWLAVAALMLGGTTLPSVPAEAVAFTNPSPIAIPDADLFSPYPSTINVTGLTGTITDVNITLNDFFTAEPKDVDVVVIGPDGSYTTLMTDAGAGYQAIHENLTFDDAASSYLPATGELVSGTYLPTNLGSYFLDVSLTNTLLSVFNGKSPNGIWSLYGGDDTHEFHTPGYASSFAGGWTLNITTAPPVNVYSFSPPQGAVGDAVRITGDGFDGATAVKFGGTPAGTFTVNSPTQITARVPGAAVTGPITVVGPGGSASSSANFVVTPASFTHVRDVSITLNGRKAKGTVNVKDGFSACGSNVPVKVQHRKHGKWKTVAGVLTNSSGAYTAIGLRASGKYRTVAKETTLSSGDVCLKDVSLIAKK